MQSLRYCTGEWLAECFRQYGQNPRYRQELQKLTLVICFRVQAEPAWGLERDILFGASLEAGEMKRLDFFTEEDAIRQSDFILSAPPAEWKKILRREHKFLTDFMVGKIVLEQGSKVGILSIAPHANTLVDVLTPLPLQFPDEMTPEELEAYRPMVGVPARAIQA